jgi:regulatory protein
MKAKWTKDIAMQELTRWCAAQERCHSDVRTKLIEHGIYGDDLEDILATLISENFLNELRFAKAYVSGKLRINEWGRVKIKYGLMQKGISTYNINKALDTIDEEEYLNTLQKILQQKLKTQAIKTLADKKKMYNFLAQKGFEQHLILHIINKP